MWTIVLENSGVYTSFGLGQVAAPYLARTLPLEGAFLPNYYGTGHSSLDNYIAMTSGQGPNPATQGDCHDATTMGGLSRADAFLKKWVPLIQASPAYKKDGLLVIIFDEGVTGLSCCGEKTSPNVGSGTNSGFPFPGPLGAGGGQTGAILISKFIKPGTISLASYNHYSYLRSMEDIFGLGHLGYAAQDGLRPFGDDIFASNPLTGVVQ